MGQQQQDLKKSLISPADRKASPVVICEEEEDIINWDFYLENPPMKPTSTIELEFEYAGRSQPIPVTDPWEEWVNDRVVRDLSDRFKVKPEEICDRITGLQSELKATQKQLDAVKAELAIAKSDQLIAQAETVGEFKILVANLGEGVDPEALKTAAERLQNKLGNSAVFLASVSSPDKVSLVAAFSPEVNKKGLQAGKFIGGIAKLCGGGGGGRPNLAQAGGRDASKLSEALETAKNQLIAGLK